MKNKSILHLSSVQKHCNPSSHYKYTNSRDFKRRVSIHLKGYNGTLQSWPLHMRINYRAGVWLNRDYQIAEYKVKKLIPAYTTSLYPALFTATW